MSERTRLLGIDYGSVRIGLAISDPERRIASPLATYARRGALLDARYFKVLIEKEEVGQLVVGLPVHMSGQEGAKAAEARAFGRRLAEATQLPLVFWDERYTTVQAEAHLQSAGLTRKGRKSRRDRVAAQIMLQSYLDAGCPIEETPHDLIGE